MRLLLAALCLLAAPALAADRLPADPDPARWVDPMIGTRDMGHVYPGATVPFGGVQLSPDTKRVGMYDDAGRYTGEAYPYCSGYQFADSTIVGFSHTHFSGTGHSDLGDVSVMPFSGAVDLADPATWTRTVSFALRSAAGVASRGRREDVHLLRRGDGVDGGVRDTGFLVIRSATGSPQSNPSPMSFMLWYTSTSAVIPRRTPTKSAPSFGP